MSLLREVVHKSKSLRRVQRLLGLAFCGFFAANGFGQLLYLTDTRSVSGFAMVNNVGQYNSDPFYTTSYSGDYSGSSSPSGQFADFQGNLGGTATFNGGLALAGGQKSPMTITSTVTSSQYSFLHATELYFGSYEGSWGTPDSGGQISSQWSGQGESSLQVTFEVSTTVAYRLSLEGTGDPFASSDGFSLSSSGQGTLAGGDTASMLRHGQYGAELDYSGTFTPGNIYTLTLDSMGNQDGGGLMADLAVPEPSMTALAGLAFLIFLLRAHRIGQQALVKVPIKVPTRSRRKVPGH